MMTAISKLLTTAALVTLITACGSSNHKKEDLYTVTSQFSSSQFEDCSLSVLTQANHKAKVRSESKDSLCELKVKINKLNDKQFLMSLKVELKNKNTVRQFNSKVIGVLGETMVLEQHKSKAEDTKYTFLIEKLNSL